MKYNIINSKSGIFIKNICFILLLIISRIICSGQTYESIVDTNKLWSTVCGCMPETAHSYYIKITTDTIIYDYTYKKVMWSNDPLQIIWKNIGFIREDTSKKVYFMDTLDNVGLIYDFEVNINDTINFYNPWNSFNFPVKIDSIYTTLINGYPRNAIDVLGLDSLFYGGYETWIEGIGSKKGIIECGQGLNIAVGWDCVLLCFYENNSLVYQDPFFYPFAGSCYYSPQNNTNYRKEKIIKLEIYPNPANNKLYIQGNIKSDNLYLEIYNPFGQLIKKFRVTSNEFINLDAGFTSGLYFCILKDEFNVLDRTKLIINEN
ncbi:MAG: T9SS type A sorting domain-containing protein [Bacteroidia bacterium]|nr:T9SS type A sorting domain-containing protein [Bacteroidia bacterium]